MRNLRIQEDLINWLESSSDLYTFTDPNSEQKAVASSDFVFFFDETNSGHVIEVLCDQVRILFFVDTPHGERLVNFLQNGNFNDDEALFSANELVYERLNRFLNMG